MKQLLDLLIKNNLTIGSVESMTGGLFASNLASIPGASKAYKGSIVSYSVKVKEELLGIEHNLIQEYGVVSEEVALEMAKRGQKLLDVDVCVSVTGNAGPTAEPGEEGVGIVYISVANEDKIMVKRLHLDGDRNEIRQKTVLSMKELVIDSLKK